MSDVESLQQSLFAQLWLSDMKPRVLPYLRYIKPLLFIPNSLSSLPLPLSFSLMFGLYNHILF